VKIYLLSKGCPVCDILVLKFILGRSPKVKESVSFCVGCILLTKSLLCNVAVFIRETALSRVYSSAMSFKKIL
jgi:hypothetical protein